MISLRGAGIFFLSLSKWNFSSAGLTLLSKSSIFAPQPPWAYILARNTVYSLFLVGSHASIACMILISMLVFVSGVRLKSLNSLRSCNI